MDKQAEPLAFGNLIKSDLTLPEVNSLLWVARLSRSWRSHHASCQNNWLCHRLAHSCVGALGSHQVTFRLFFPLTLQPQLLETFAASGG